MRGICILMAAVVLCVLAGCGDSGSTASDSGAKPLTKPQFITQADALCARAQREKNAMLLPALKKLAKKGGATTDKDKEELVLEVVPPMKEMSEKLAQLGPPKGDEEEVEKIVDTIAEEVETLEDEPIKGAEDIPFEESNELANAYGMKQCSQL